LDCHKLASCHEQLHDIGVARLEAFPRGGLAWPDVQALATAPEPGTFQVRVEGQDHEVICKRDQLRVVGRRETDIPRSRHAVTLAVEVCDYGFDHVLVDQEG
jgi:hypothetical protein